MAAVGDGNLREFSVSTRQRERERVKHGREMGKKGKEGRREGEGVWPGDSGSRSSRSGGRGAMGLYELGDGAHG